MDDGAFEISETKGALENESTITNEEAESNPSGPLLTARERSDIRQSLEHLMVVGAYNRHQSWRVSEFKRRRLNNTLEVETEDLKSIMRPLEWKPTHMEDIRVYNDSVYDSSIAGESMLWPEPKTVRNRRVAKLPQNVDRAWFQEYGDDNVDPNEFQRSLSSRLPPPVASGNNNECEGDLEIASPPGEMQGCAFCTNGNNDMSFQLIERCWQRAVHAAASLVETNLEKSPVVEEKGEFKPCYKETVEKCRHLSIPGPGNNPSWRCPVCCFSSVKHNDRLVHFFGNKSTRGCAWRVIEEKRMILIREALSAEARYQRDVLVEDIVLAPSEPEVDDNVRDWEFVISKLRARAKNVSGSMLVAEVFVQEDVLGNAERRLIERYSNVPK